MRSYRNYLIALAVIGTPIIGFFFVYPIATEGIRAYEGGAGSIYSAMILFAAGWMLVPPCFLPPSESALMRRYVLIVASVSFVLSALSLIYTINRLRPYGLDQYLFRSKHIGPLVLTPILAVIVALLLIGWLKIETSKNLVDRR
jgi:hypothetical protein